MWPPPFGNVCHSKSSKILSVCFPRTRPRFETVYSSDCGFPCNSVAIYCCCKPRLTLNIILNSIYKSETRDTSSSSKKKMRCTLAYILCAFYLLCFQSFSTKFKSYKSSLLLLIFGLMTVFCVLSYSFAWEMIFLMLRLLQSHRHSLAAIL